MVLNYKIKESDFLAFQLFTASKSKRINDKKKKGRLILTLTMIVFGILFYTNKQGVLATYFGAVAIIYGIFYPTYFRWRYKRHYRAYIKEVYFKRFDQSTELELSEKGIFSKDKIGEARVSLTEIEKVIETQEHYFLEVSSGASFIIPKREITNHQEVKSKLRAIGLTLQEELNWKWKP